MTQPHAAIITGYGINCEEETHYAFEQAGARSTTIHINDLIDGIRTLQDYQILAFPGGFSYGDDTGSGNALANRIRNTLTDKLHEFVHKDKLIIGICNGFQVLTHLGLTPALDKNYGTRDVALVHNDNARYTVRWVDLQFTGSSPWTKNLGQRSLPIAHGEGKFYAEPITLKAIKEKGLVAARYVEGELCTHHHLPANPNGSLDDIAAITDETGRILGMMPHPERAITFTHLPHWTLLKETAKRTGQPLPPEGPGLQLLKNGVNYFTT